MQFGKDRAVPVLRALREDEVSEIMAAIALVLAHMHPDAAALVLGAVPADEQRDVAQRVAKMDRTSPEVIEQVETILARKLSTVIQQSDFSSAGGVQSLVDILNRSDRAT